MARGSAVCWLVALVLSTTLASAGTAAEPDCVNSESRPVRSGGTNGVTSVFAIDLDGDDDIDILSASANDDKIAWYENNGTGMPFTEHVISTNADGASSVYAGHLNNDVHIDVVSASANDDKIAWYENLGGDPPLFIERVITTDADNAASVIIADVDGKNGNDIVSASINDDTIAVYENDGASSPTFTEVIIADFADGAASVFAENIFLDPDPDSPDDDDELEVLSASRFDDRIAWYEKVVLDADADVVVYVERVIDASADGATSVFAKDIDGDSYIDVLSASGNDNRISWYRNDGADPPSFTKQVISNQVDGPSAVFAADLDGDFQVDVISASRFDNKIAWYRNLGGGDFGDPTDNQEIITTDAPGAAAVYAIDVSRHRRPGRFLRGRIDCLGRQDHPAPERRGHWRSGFHR
jgi:hypothetical protein